MNIYEKILASLKTKYANLGLGDSVLESVAKQLEAGVKEEAQVETAVDGVSGMLKLFQTELDKGRNERTGLQKKLTELTKAEEERKKAEEEAKKKAEEEAARAAEEATRKKAEEEARKHEETPEQLFERLFQSKQESITKTYEERVNKQAEEIKKLTDKLKAQDDARAEAEKLAGYKATAAKLGIAESYEPVVMAFASTAKDAKDFETRITAFKQTLVDDGSRSAVPPATAEQQQAQEGEEIAKLIDAGTKQIVEQRKN